MDGKGASLDSAIAEFAARQHGVVSAAQLRATGVSDDAIRARALAGRLHRVHQGVYAVGHTALAPQGRAMAAVLAVARGNRRETGSVLEVWGAAVSHRSAAYLWGLLPEAEGSVDVIVPGHGGKKRRRGLRVHRSSTLVQADVTLRVSIPVTTPRRTIADLRTALARSRPGAASERELHRAIRQANVLGLPIDEEGRRDRTRSDLEGDFFHLCIRRRLPPPEVNVRIGRYLVDFLWRERRLIVETDSYLYHRGSTAFSDDRRRDLELRLLGYEVIRISERQLAEEPGRVAGAISALLDLTRRDQP